MKISFKFLSSSYFLSIASSILIFIFIFSAFSFYSQKTKLQELEDRLSILQKKAVRKEHLAKTEEKILSKLKNCDPNYYKKILGSIHFMEKEKEQWKIFLSQVEPSEAMKNRADFLERKNRLEFTEGEEQKTPLFIETELKQQAPIEINEEDLKILLATIEGTQIPPYIPAEGSPQFLIQTFELTKKNSFGTKDKSYTLYMELIQRQGAF